MCFPSIYDSMDSEILSELNQMMLNDAVQKEEKKKLRKQEKEQKRIQKVKAKMEKKYGAQSNTKKETRDNSDSSSTKSAGSHRHHRHHQSRQASCSMVADREEAPAHITHTDFGEFQSAPPPLNAATRKAEGERLKLA